MHIFEAVIEAYNSDSIEDYIVFIQYYQSSAGAESGIAKKQWQIADKDQWENNEWGDSFYQKNNLRYTAYIRKIVVLS